MPMKQKVFPTHVGVFLCIIVLAFLAGRLPHARGGVSSAHRFCATACLSSPRTWGCFYILSLALHCFFVFPTHVGVFLLAVETAPPRASLPHARGGVSWWPLMLELYRQSSPRTWGCFHAPHEGVKMLKVFPTHVGVFLGLVRLPGAPTSLPHARGGVSQKPKSPVIPRSSSPRTWGCFPGSLSGGVAPVVFPTHVGVFPPGQNGSAPAICLPHARGGVSDGHRDLLVPRGSSPRTWGCFCAGRGAGARGSVFPTHVGVFPKPRPAGQRRQSLPHARGGVS